MKSRFLNQSQVAIFRKLMPYYKDSIPLLIVGVIGVILTSISTLGIGIVLREFVSSESIVIYVKEHFIFSILMILSLSVGSMLRSFAMNFATEKSILNMATTAYIHVMKLPITFFKQPANIISRFSSDMTTSMKMLGNNISFLIRNILVITGCVVMIFISSLSMSFMALMVIPVIVAIVIIVGRIVRKASKQSQEKVAALLEKITEAINGIIVVKSFCKEQRIISMFINARNSLLQATKAMLTMRSLFVGFIIIAIFALLTIIAAIGFHHLSMGHITKGELSSFMFYAFMASITLGAMVENITEIQHALAACERLLSLLDETPESIEGHNTSITKSEAKIIFNNVSFTYPGAKHSALSSFSLSINAGESISVVGISGSGKSTLCMLMMGMYNTTSGCIFIDGTPIHEIELHKLRNMFGYVPSEPALFSGSLLENITFGLDQYTLDEVMWVVKIAALEELVASVGLEYTVTPRSDLSSGQKQRVAIARALLKKPDILLFDEASSALDYNTDQVIRNNIDSAMPYLTKIFVTHRLQTVKETDRVIIIARGKLEGSGTIDELMEQNPAFMKLIQVENGDS